MHSDEREADCTRDVGAYVPEWGAPELDLVGEYQDGEWWGEEATGSVHTWSRVRDSIGSMDRRGDLSVRIVSEEPLYGDPTFYKILGEMAELHSRKNRDYSPGDAPLKNFYECEDLEIPAWKGVLVRLSDKWSRIKNLAKKDSVAANESLEDSLLDSAVYNIICLVLRRRAHEKVSGKQLSLAFDVPDSYDDWLRTQYPAEHAKVEPRNPEFLGSYSGLGKINVGFAADDPRSTVGDFEGCPSAF